MQNKDEVLWVNEGTLGKLYFTIAREGNDYRIKMNKNLVCLEIQNETEDSVELLVKTTDPQQTESKAQ